MGLSAHTEIRLSDGVDKPAEQLRAGDSVREAMTGEPRLVKDVVSVPAVGMMRITADNGAVLDLTEDHRILTNFGLVDAGRVKEGEVFPIPGGMCQCSGTERLLGDYRVYDPVVADDAEGSPCLVANGFVVDAVKAK